MNELSILFIVLGIIFGLISFAIFISTVLTLKDQKSWDDFYKVLQEKNLPVSEEELYRTTCKINFWSCTGLIASITLLATGILIQIIK